VTQGEGPEFKPQYLKKKRKKKREVPSPPTPPHWGQVSLYEPLGINRIGIPIFNTHTHTHTHVLISLTVVITAQNIHALN
jgi:hypothetical protein